MTTHAEQPLRTAELTVILEARGFVYRLLAGAFLAEPTRDTLSALAASGMIRLFPFGERSARIREGMAETDRYLSDPASATDAACEGLHWDYTRLFIGPDRLPAPPWESAYRTEDRLLFQAETLAVREAYLTYGFQNRNYLQEPDDHIGLELEFMEQTCRLAAQYVQAGNMAAVTAICTDQLHFLTDHLLTWGPAFATDVAGSARTGFYRGMAQLLAGFLPVDRGVLVELLHEPWTGEGSR